MSLTRKISQRISDPVFYRKKISGALRPFRRFADKPRPLNLSSRNWERVLVVLAHPDDETFCSGLIAEMSGRGIEVTVLCLTRGEGGPTGGIERSELGRAREEEMRRACEVLGVNRLVFLDHVDPVASKYRVFAPDVSVDFLVEQMASELGGSSLVISHGSNGEYWHPAHLLVFQAVRASLRHWTGDPPDWLTFMARQPNHPMPRLVNWDDEADCFLEVSHLRETREKALIAHRTQLALFGRFAGGDHGDFLDQTATETYCVQFQSEPVS